MRFDIPRHVALFTVLGLVLLAAAGAADAMADSLRQNYQNECGSFDLGFRPHEPGNETQEPEPLTPQERQECRDARLPVTVAEAVHRGALAPGIAIVAIAGVYLLGAAIAAIRRG